METSKFTGHTYQAETGQWSWIMVLEGDEYCRCGEHSTEAEAQAHLEQELVQLNTDTAFDCDDSDTPQVASYRVIAVDRQQNMQAKEI